FYTPEVLPKHRDLMRDIEFYRAKVGILIYEHLCEIGKIATTVVPRTIDFTELIIIDEAERLTPTALELLRDLHDRHHVALMFIGMPGIDQRFRHYPQLYSRLGFSHCFQALAQDALPVAPTRHSKRLRRPRDHEDLTDAQSIAAIERLTRGNSRPLERLFPQIGRDLKINQLDTITDNVIEAAASTLVTG